MSKIERQGLTRRALLARSVAAGALVVTGAGFLAAPDAAWAMEVSVISEHQMATLIQMARDIYPHDRIADQFYAIAVKGYDADDKKALVEEGVAALDAAAQVYRDWLERDPDNPTARHLLAATTGEEVPERAADDYVATYFDASADDREPEGAR